MIIKNNVCNEVREMTFFDIRDMMAVRDSEYKAWAQVQSLKSSLNEHNLESRVKAANEAEALSQQRLATSEAEISELRQKLEDTTRCVSDKYVCIYFELLTL